MTKERRFDYYNEMRPKKQHTNQIQIQKIMKLKDKYSKENLQVTEISPLNLKENQVALTSRSMYDESNKSKACEEFRSSSNLKIETKTDIQQSQI